MLFALLCLVLMTACGGPDGPTDPSDGTIEFESNRPDPGSSGDENVEPYSGSNPHVQKAQKKFRTPLDLHRKVIQRTCSPTGGVCHNRKEYPDLHTPANFLSAVGAPCNVEPGDYASVFDRCERPGDRFKFADEDFREIEIGYIERVRGEYVDWNEKDGKPGQDAAGLHIYLHDPVPVDRDEMWATGQFIRTFVDAAGDVRDLAYANYRTRWWILDGGKHLMAEIKDYQVDQVNELVSVGIVQGDLNRNGTYGARKSEPASLLEPGHPEKSYLIARLRGTMEGEDVPGTRMPLANQPLSIPEMLALYCFVEGLPDDLEGTPSGTAPIDYNACSYTDDPEELNLLGEGVTWSGRISKVLEANCGGCHGGTNPSADFNVLSDDAYDNVLADSTQKPEMKRVKAGEPENSYLWWKINARNNDDFADQIVGQAMPINPIDGQTTLSEAERSDIKTWIENGALDE